jgi:methyltransferase-like protein/2-polyprenyl-3-methyl-5-hydroxy-6-metoxy-1,4-benzoquinol methylase
MSDDLLKSYEETPYHSNPISSCHPDCLATMATLYGMRPPPIERCRVLELGCAGGGNLISMALALPASRFVGIDLSPRQIGEGQEVVTKLGLKNIELRPLSILDVGQEFGTFDYILCHGVYSWVPPAVQDKILAICSQHLAPDGVAFVSYNTYPGWHLRGMICEMLRYHVRQYSEPAVRVQQARVFLEFLAHAVGETGTLFGQLLKEEAELLRPLPDSYLLHEQLEKINQPLYFHEFAARAAAHGLQYLSEARLGVLDGQIDPSLDEALQHLADDLLQREQYLDFLRNRTFRKTLLCRAGVALNRSPQPAIVRNFLLTSFVRPVSAQPDASSDAVEQFRGPFDVHITTNNPLLKTPLVCLGETAPRAVSFDELHSRVQARLGWPDGPTPQALAEAVLQCFLSNLIEMHVYAPPLVARLSDRPVASPLARLQAENNVARVTSLWHHGVELTVLDLLVLRLLDGSRDRAALRDALAQLVQEGVLTITHEGQPLTEPNLVRQAVSGALEPCLLRLLGFGLLAG